MVRLEKFDELYYEYFFLIEYIYIEGKGCGR